MVMKVSRKGLPKKIQAELKKAYNKYTLQVGVEMPYGDESRKEITDTLQVIYENESRDSRGDSFVPCSKSTWKFISDSGDRYEIIYKWPENEFTSDVSYPNIIERGSMIDKLGGPFGRYVCPCDRQVYSAADRAIPYYFLENKTEDEPSYHRYIVKRDITMPALLDELEKSDKYNTPEKEKIKQELKNDEHWLKYGTIAEVSDFGKQGIGGGKQYCFPVQIQVLIDLEFIDVC